MGRREAFLRGGEGGFGKTEELQLIVCSSKPCVGEVHDECKTVCVFFFGGGGGLNTTGDLPLTELCSFTEDISTSFCIDFGSSKDCILVKDAGTPFPADLAFAPATGQ